MAKITLKNVSKRYGPDHCVVKDFNLNIADREFVILVGPSGCGKSTTLRMIAGLEDISDGELWIDGQFCNYLDPQERGMSMVFQNYALYPNMTVYGNLAFSLKIRKYSKKEIDGKVHQVAKILEIEHLLKQRPSNLSGGQKQRVAIGSAIIRKPKVFLMDEPLSNLDAKLRAQMRVELAKLHENLGTTVIYVTHDQTEAMTLGTKIVVMKEGEIQQIDSPKRLYNCPANRFVAEFVGSPSMNFFRCTVANEDGRAVLLMPDDCESPSSATQKRRIYPEGVLTSRLLYSYTGKEVIVGIRPEDIYEYQEAAAKGFSSSTIGIEKIVKVREMLGMEVILYFEEQGKFFTARLSPENRSKTGEPIKLFFNPQKLHVFDSETEMNILQ